MHLLCSGLDISEKKSLRLNKQHFSEVQQEIQGYIKTRFQELSDSIINYGYAEKQLNQVSQTEYEIKKKGRISKKELFKKQIEQLVLQSNSSEEFQEKLSKSNIKAYFRKGKLTGYLDPTSNRKYRIATLKLEPALETLELKSKASEEVGIHVQRKTQEPIQEVYRKTNPEREHSQYDDVMSELEEIRRLSEERDMEEPEIDY